MSCLVVGNHTQGLGIIRSLGRNGIKPRVLYDKHVSMARFSRYCSSFHRVPKGVLKTIYRKDVQDTVEHIMLTLVPEGEKWVLFGVSEDITNFFYDRRESLAKKFLFPENDIACITDKYSFARKTNDAGVRSPDTYLMSEFDESLLDDTKYVAKGRVGNKFRNISDIKGFTVESPSDLATIREHIANKVREDEVILQEIVESDANIHSCCGFAVNGKLLVVFMYEKVRQTPDQFGTGSYSVSRDVPELRDKTRAIICELEYTGIFEIEYLKDREIGEFNVIEMNPRTWKSVELSTACGKNLCLHYFRYLHQGVVPVPSYEVPVGKCWAHLAVDVVHMLKNRDFRFKYNRDIVFCDLAMDDPFPFAVEVFLLPLIKLGI